MFQVQKILDKRVDKRTKKQYYLVKWQGWNDEQASWEPYQHLSDCEEFVQAFQQQFGHIEITQFGKIRLPKQKKIHKKMKVNKQKKSQKKCQQKQEQYQNNEDIMQKISPVKKFTLNNQQEYTKLHRRNSIEKIQFKNSNFNIVEKPNNATYLNEEALNSHKKRQKQREVSNPPTRTFAPIIISNQFPRLTRRTSIHGIKEAQQQANQPQPQMKVKQPSKTQLIDKIDIIGMRKSPARTYQFFISKDGQRKWVSHAYVFENYTKQLCKFYQRSIVLE